MNDDTRKLLKVFGVAVTDAEAEAERLAGTAAQLSARERLPRTKASAMLHVALQDTHEESGWKA